MAQNTSAPPSQNTSSTSTTLPIRGVLVAIGFETLAVVILSVIAEQSDRAGTVVIWLLVALWVLFLVSHGTALKSVPTIP